MKTSLVLLLTVLTYAVTAGGLLRPGQAAASISQTNPWPAIPHIVSNGNTGTATGKVVVAPGQNRLMLVAVACEYTATPASQTITVTYGGRSVTQIATNITQRSTIWLGYLNESNINAATSTTLSVTNSQTANLTAMYVSAAAYDGVDQTTPTTGSASVATAGALSMTLGSYAVSGKVGILGTSVYVANWNGQTSTPASGYTEEADYAGTNFNLAACFKAISASGNEAPVSTAAVSTSGAMIGVGLNPYLKLATVTTCGDCHGTPPIDSAARNVPDGNMPGSHNKHAGSAELQYGYTCTKCHYNNTTTNHSLGFKNITGSSLPGNAYSQGKRLAITNNPTLGTCTNTACHSTARPNVQYTTTPSWGGAAMTCLSCHGGRNGATGAPAKSTAGFGLSTTHSQHLKYTVAATGMNCNICHAKTAADAATLKSYSGVTYHVNGQKEVLFTNLAYASYTSYKAASKTCNNTSCHGGKTRNAWANNTAINSDNTCVHCHGVAGTTPLDTNRNKYAPGWGGNGISTDGNTAVNDPRVGAHFVHLSSVYIKKLKCNECHLVPSSPFEAGHTDTLRFSSGTITFAQASSANRNGVSPAYLVGGPTTPATCTVTYCHGSGMKNGDTSGTDKTPQWNQNLTTGTPGTTECARCHGNPPTAGTTAGTHSGRAATTSCVTCHGNVVDATGKIVNKASHGNGAVETQMYCNSCHAYDTTDTWNTTFGVEGIGAHVKHIAYIKNRWSITLYPATDTFGTGNAAAVCGVCHTVTPGDHTTGGGGSRNINFGGSTARQFGASAPLYNGSSGTSSSVNPKSCSNIDCHYKTSPIWQTY